jgi:hypothetical protein
MSKPSTRVSRDHPDVILHADFDFDTNYFEQILKEVSNEPNYPKGLTVEKLMGALADSIMDQAYYIFQDYLESMSS